MNKLLERLFLLVLLAFWAAVIAAMGLYARVTYGA